MELPKIVDTMFPKTAKKLLNELATKKLTLAEFLTECAYWALKDGFNQLFPKSYPDKPSKANELEGMPEHEQSKFNYLDYFSKNPDVKLYYDKKAEIQNWNKGTEEWLADMFKYVPEEDFVSRGKIRNIILEFRSKCQPTSQKA